ncbi:MAG: hypothetical protein O6952_09270 [Planctomycetota bacterium]|nr:hypothetical protein [Planctomycetota bacterium]
MESSSVPNSTGDGGSGVQRPDATPGSSGYRDRALMIALIVYVALLAVATYAEIFENDWILGFFR